MCGIAGFCSPRADYNKEKEKWEQILQKMNQVQRHRGPDEEGIRLEKHCGMGHVRLAVMDQKKGRQPMSKTSQGRTCTISYDGEIYNAMQLRRELENQGVLFETDSDAEILLQGYLRYGEAYVEKCNGVFAIALWDSHKETLFLFRDRVGAKPLFYTKKGEGLIYSSEIKGLFAYPQIAPRLDQDGLCEIFALGPAKTYGKGVFRDIMEILPGHYLTYRDGVLRDHCYWKLESHIHEDTLDQTVEKTSWLIEDAVKKQMRSDVPISTFLSGGLDSSLVTAICAEELKKQGNVLDTFSFDFEGNQSYFQANPFQPSQDRPWVEQMVLTFQTNHHFLECDNRHLADELYHAVDGRDLPCMADVESSMLHFCSLVQPHNKVALTGECADEIFGGYPWFHKKEAFETDAFPWSADMKFRCMLLSDEVLQTLPLDEYAHAAYRRTIAETPILEGEQEIEKRRREIAYLNLRWFMVTLLDRMDRTSMHCSLSARVPLADYRIIEYVWNVPWEMKCQNGVEKSLLRRTGEGKLPKEVLYRKKSPYPKTYHPAYERMLSEQLKEVLRDPNAPIRPFLNPEKTKRFLERPKDYGKPWYGQLMAGPQMIAYLLQINYWMKRYQIQLV